MSGNEGIYSDTELGQLYKHFDWLRGEGNSDDDFNERSFIELVFGTHGRLRYEEFIEIVADKASFFFSAPKIREALFEQADLPIKHI